VSPPPPVLVLGAVSRSFHAGLPGCSASTLVLEGAELVVHAGERVAVVGGAGSGKTTLLLLAAGLLPADAGYVWRLPGAVLAHGEGAGRPLGAEGHGPRLVRESQTGMTPDRVVWRDRAARGALLVEVPEGRPPPPWATRVLALRRGRLHAVAGAPGLPRAAAR
jgi:energy-coupling factor transporter ATP-binding protein EcfA2